MMRQTLANSYLFGANAPFIEELYERYLDNPAAVEPAWRDYFDKLGALPGVGNTTAPDVPHAPVIASFAQRAKEGILAAPARASKQNAEKQVKVLQLINAYRFLGNRWAQLDPLKRQERPTVAELDPSYYGFTEADLGHVFHTGSFEAVGESALRGRMCRAADFVRVTKTKGGEWEPTDTDPPLPIVRDILALGAWPFPAGPSVIAEDGADRPIGG